MSKPIYLTGPMRNFSSSQQEEFEKAKVALEKFHQLSVFSAMEEYENINFENEEHKSNVLIKRLSNLLQCGMLVTLPDFEYDVDATFEYKLAKFLNMKIIGITFALKPESLYGNTNTQTNTELTNASDQQS